MKKFIYSQNTICIIMYTLLIFLMYGKSLTVYFVQDDFYFLSFAILPSLKSILALFTPQPDVVWFRPISSQLFFFIAHLLFGYKVVYFHVIVFFTHILAAYLVYVFVKNLTANNLIGYISGLIYGLHQIHTLSLSWLATYSFVLGPLLLLLTFHEYQRKKYVHALLCFTLGILSLEVIILTPLILISYQLLVGRRLIIKTIYPYLLIIFVFILVRMILFPTHVNTYQYAVTFDFGINVLKFYLLRIIGIPLLFPPLSTGIKVIIVAGAGVICIGGFLGLVFAFKHNYIERRTVVFLLLSCAVLLLPFLGLPQHVAPYYESFALIFWAVLSSIGIYFFTSFFGKKYMQAFLMVFLMIYMILQIIGSQWTYATHWIFRRAVLAEKLIKEKQFSQRIGSEEFFSLGADAIFKVYK